MTMIHFHGSDDRFCGSTHPIRRFTLDPNEVTCQACKDRDTFILSASGTASLRELGYLDKDGREI